MKRLIIFLILISACILFSDEFYEGIHGGMNFATMKVDQGEDPESINGYMFGIFLDKPISDNTAWSFGVNFSKKGYKQKRYFESDDIFYDQTNTYNYITLPLQFKLTSSRDEETNFFIGAGISTNFKISSKYEYKKEDGEKGDGDLDNVSLLELSAVFSSGFYINEFFKIEFIYDLGLTDLNSPTFGEDIKAKSRTASVLIGIIRVL